MGRKSKNKVLEAEADFASYYNVNGGRRRRNRGRSWRNERVVNMTWDKLPHKIISFQERPGEEYGRGARLGGGGLGQL
jgi:hypothetical protein